MVTVSRTRGEVPDRPNDLGVSDRWRGGQLYGYANQSWRHGQGSGVPFSSLVDCRLVGHRERRPAEKAVIFFIVRVEVAPRQKGERIKPRLTSRQRPMACDGFALGIALSIVNGYGYRTRGTAARSDNTKVVRPDRTSMPCPLPPRTSPSR